MKLSWSIPDGETWALGALAAGDSAAFLSGMLPSIFTIRHFNGDWSNHVDTTGDIHKGMLIANVLALVIGFGASAVSDSWWPLMFTVGATIILDLSYEWALRSPHAS